jgi:hypothetical protein
MVRGLSRQGGIKFKIEKVNIISYAIKKSKINRGDAENAEE